jgi:hypothetical protein
MVIGAACPADANSVNRRQARAKALPKLWFI